MYTQHDSFNPPQNEKMRVWRYLDISKFTYMLYKQALFFPKASKLNDQFEGSYTKKSIDTRNEIFKTIAKGLPNSTIEKQVSEFARQVKNHVYISSWHMSAFESAAMWSLYSQGGKGIAIQSTFERLKKSFEKAEEQIYIGKVKYIDYDKDLIDTKNVFNPFLRKRKSFEYEHELRALTANLTEASFGQHESGSTEGVYVQTDLDILIEKIYISPAFKEWEKELIKELIKKFEISKEIVESSLSSSPIF